MIEDDFIFNEDPFDDYDPIPEILEDPVPTFEPEPPIVIDEPEPPLPSSPGSIGSNNSGWPCACTGLYI
ncbi:MAG: hypothetical protein LUD00_04055 [Prevotellaceae bacterium]|nr:hypothetical protein [Prevotellaceae bacterium]